MKKTLALSVAISMVLSLIMAFLPMAPAMADPAADNSVTRRALIIGNTNYAESPLEAPVYDARHMAELFKQMNFSGMSGSAAEQGQLQADNITMKNDRTAGQILKDITAAFAGADEDDVSYFYYSGHGSVLTGEAQLVGVDMVFLSLEDLKGALDKVPGTKIIMLDSCFSGGFINKSNTTSAVTAAVTGGGLSLAHNNPRKPARDAGIRKPQKKKSSNWNDVFPASLRQLPPKKGKPLDEQFNGSVAGTFSKTSRYIDSGKYVVFTAAADNQYSYEFPFALTYGPLFKMPGVPDLADKYLAYSGEFTGMLVAGAGIVTFHPDFGQVGLLADYNGDKAITAGELQYFLKGAVTASDVMMYPSDGDVNPDVSANTVIFSHDSGLVLENPARVSLPDGIGSVATAADATSVRISVNPPAGINNKLVIYRYPKTTDGEGANGYVGQLAVRTFENVAAGITVWDGKDDKGADVPDGTYRITLEIGADMVQQGDPPKVYPGLAVVMARGLTEYDGEATFTAGDNTWTASGIANISVDGQEQCVWFEAPADGAMNVNADLSNLNPEQIALCTLYDNEGNIVNYNYSKMQIPLYLPFAVEQGKKYYLRFSLDDNPDSTGDTGSFTYTLKLNGTVAFNTDIPAGGNLYEAWLVKPAAAVAGDYYIQSSGDADTAATLLDSNQITRIASNDDFVDKQFFLRTPLIAGHGYLLVVRNYQNAMSVPYSFCVSDSAHLPAFDTSGITDIGNPDDDLVPLDAVSNVGTTTYRKIVTGDNAETWSFFTDQLGMDGLPIDMSNDPCMMLIDQNYNVIGQNDDYNYSMGSMDFPETFNEGEDYEDYGYDFNSSFAAVLQPNKTYILACRSSYVGPYEFEVVPVAKRLTPDDYTVQTPKTVFADNGGAAMDRYGNVTTWGINMSGELGLGTQDPSPTPQVVILPSFGQARNIWASDTMMFARLEWNQYCYWGMPYYYDYEMPVGGLVPVLLDSLDGMDIADIQCGAGTLALIRTYTGDLYMLDLESSELEPVDLPGEAAHSVKQISASDSSFFALTYGGDVYSWGENWSGECGVGNTRFVEIPTKVNVGGNTVTEIATGWDHALALTASGDVYAWGFNKNNELGLGVGFTKLYSTLPVKVAGGDIAGLKIKAVYAGCNHSMCVDESGNAYAWGFNLFGELGLGHAAMTPDPEKIGFYNNPSEDNVQVMSMAAGMFAVFAQDFTHNVYGYGSNMDYQLANAGMPSIDGIKKLMTLMGDVETGHSTALAAVHVNSGLAIVQDDMVFVVVGENDETCYIIPEPEDAEATYTIDGDAVMGKTFDSPNPGGQSGEIPIVVSHAGKTPTTFTMVIYRQMSTNANLRSIGVTAGSVLSPAFSQDVYRYTLTLPETMARARISPVVDGYGAHYKIDTLAADTSKLYAPGVGQTLYSTIKVTAQDDTYTKTYNMTIRRPYMLSALSAKPVASGYPSLSPGGTNRMRIYYSLTFAANVKIEVKKGTTWYSVMSRADKAGSLYWDWDGKVRGAYLAAGTYTIRVTPTYNGTACAAKLLTVKILGKPVVSIPSLSPTTLINNGTNKITFTVKWTVVSNVKVEIVNAAGTVVYTVWDVTNQLPATKTLYWLGKSASGSLVPAGTYKIKVTCGGATVVYKSFTVRR